MPKIALLLLPGLDGTGLLFEDFVAALAPEFDPIVIRYPVDVPLGYAELEVLARRSLPSETPFILLGESFGGPLAISIAASRPAGLAGLVLCCTFSQYPRALFRRLHRLAPFLPMAGPLVSLARKLVAPEPVSRSVCAKLDTARSMVAGHVMRARVAELLRIDLTHQLARVSVPILDLRAAKDGIVPNRSAQPIRALGQRVRAVDLNGPHFLLLAKPGETAAIVGNFAREAMNERSGDTQQSPT